MIYKHALSGRTMELRENEVAKRGILERLGWAQMELIPDREIVPAGVKPQDTSGALLPVHDRAPSKARDEAADKPKPKPEKVVNKVEL